MRAGSDVVLFLGAGASLPEPAGCPLFGAVRDACARRAGVDTAAWARCDPRRKLLEHVIPEVFLKSVSEAGYELRQPLSMAVAGSDSSGPNAVHELAAEVISGGGTVWTTNWDMWIERAHGRVATTPLVAALYGTDGPPGRGGLGKLHGSSDRPESLRFASSDVIRPLDPGWHRCLVDSCRDRLLFVVGYGGADVDLYAALTEAVQASKATYWFEGTSGASFADHLQAHYEVWRFRLDGGRVDDPRSLAARGRVLVWCGEGGLSGSPARGVLDAFDAPGEVAKIPSEREQFELVDSKVSTAQRTSLSRGENLYLAAAINVRLGSRWAASLRHGLVIVVAPLRLKRKSLRALGNLLLLRAHPWRRSLNRVYQAVFGSTERARFFDLQSGGVTHDADRARAVASGDEELDVDAALNLALSCRWTDDLTVAEAIARSQLTRCLAQDLTSRKRDWPERISRSAYELAQSLVWQGRFFEADDVCRTAYMRVSGAKWAAWEYAMRSVVRFAHREYGVADAHMASAIELLELEGFADFTPTLHTARAACARMLGDLPMASVHLGRAEAGRNKGPGSMAAIVGETAEQCLARQETDDAAALWEALAGSPLRLWSGIGQLRLAEEIDGEGRRAALAADAFADVQSQWGIVRTDALRGNHDRGRIAVRVHTLGPVGMFVPRGPWLI